MLPPDLHEPFVSSEDRTRAALQLVERHQVLEELERLAALPSHLWPPGQIGRFPPSIAGHQEPPAERLARWQALFADELRQVGQVRDAVVHGRVSDVELRTALYLAERLLAFAYGDGVHEADRV
jgi:hypothetical protein